jgi:hypothetical protein
MIDGLHANPFGSHRFRNEPGSLARLIIQSAAGRIGARMGPLRTRPPESIRATTAKNEPGPEWRLLRDFFAADRADGRG